MGVLARDRLEPVDDAAAEDEQAAPPTTDEHGRGSISGTVMTGGDSCGCGVLGPALLAEERHEHQPGHVEGGDAGAEQRRHSPTTTLLARTPPR